MSQETRLVPAQVTGALTDGETSTLVPVAVDEVSTKIVAAIDLIASLIPDLRTPHPQTEKKVRGARTVPREAVLAIIAMVEFSDMMRSTHLFDPEHAREVVETATGCSTNGSSASGARSATPSRRDGPRSPPRR